LTSEKAYENFRTQISKEINMPLKRSGESLYDDLRRTAAFSENEKVINEKIRNAVEKISKEYDAIKSPYFGATPAENSFELIIKKDIPLGKIQVEAKPINHIQEALVRGQIEQKLINLGKQGFELEGSKEIFKDELVNKFGQPIDNVKRIIDEVSSQPNVKKAFEREPADVLTPTEKPVEALYKSFISTDIQGNKVEQQLAKIATKKETTGGIARREGYNSIPIKEGYEIVFKPYGEKGKGYYYSRKITAAPKILKRKELKLIELPTNHKILDIGKETIKQYCKIIKNTKAVFMKGTPGYAQINGFEIGTKEILKVIASSKAFSVLAGGSLAGILGFVLAVPVVATSRILIEYFLNSHHEKN